MTSGYSPPSGNHNPIYFVQDTSSAYLTADDGALLQLTGPDNSSLQVQTTPDGGTGLLLFGALGIAQLLVTNNMTLMLFPYAEQQGFPLLLVGSGFAQMAQMAVAPFAPAPGNGVWFFRDNGAGKMQMCVQFPTGVAQVVATEP